MTKILIIEDDRDIGELIQANLRRENYETEIISSGAQGLLKAQKLKPNLIILDLMLPDVGGLEICRILKTDPKTQSIPIIMVTAKGEEIDRVVGLEMGADDYLPKPFSPRELNLRIKNLLKRSRDKQEGKSPEVVDFGLLHVDTSRHLVRVGRDEPALTAIEFKLLLHLMNNRGRVATRDRLLDQVWGYDAALTTRTVDTHIKRLRSKLKKAGDYIETIRGVGYRFKEKDDE